MYKVESVEYGTSRFGELTGFAERLYEGDPYWSQPSYEAVSGLHARHMIVHDGGTIVARGSAIINPALRYNDAPAGLIGFYESIDDTDAARTLLDALASHLRDLGMPFVIGPMNGSTWHRYRIALPSDEPPFFLDVHNKPWYAGQWESVGFTPIASYYSSRFERLDVASERVTRMTGRFAERGITIRQIDLNDFERELQRIYDVAVVGFRDNFLYTPVRFEDFAAIYRGACLLVRSELVLIAEDADDRPVAFILALDDVFDREHRSLVVKTVAALPEPALRGLGTLLVELVHERAARLGYDRLIHALMHEQNLSTRIALEHAAPYRSYTLFGRTL